MEKTKVKASNPDRALAAVAASDEENRPSRLTVDLPAGLHRRLKIRATERGMSIRSYLQVLLKADGL